jgi:ribosomal-protein-alanine N-acetyltransferase
MRRYKEVSVTVKQIDEVTCNGCGRVLSKYEDSLSIDKKWGYGTPYDGETHSLDLCVDCYTKIIDGLKLKVEKEPL